MACLRVFVCVMTNVLQERYVNYLCCVVTWGAL